MENIFFATILYTVVFSFLCWLTTPLPQDGGTGGHPRRISRDDTKHPKHGAGEPYSPSSPPRPITQSPRHPITPSPLSLNDLKNAFAVEPESEPDSEVTQQEIAAPTNTNIDTKDIETLKRRLARKIASQLGIQQKVNGKDQPLSWLRVQIQKRLEEDSSSTAPIIRACLNAA